MTTTRPDDALPHLLALIADYAAGRRQDVARGRETPELAALLVQKYGYGLCAAVKVLCDETPGVAQAILAAIDAAVAALDPAWAEHARQRWAARPAGLTLAAGGAAPGGAPE